MCFQPVVAAHRGGGNHGIKVNLSQTCALTAPRPLIRIDWIVDVWNRERRDGVISMTLGCRGRPQLPSWFRSTYEQRPSIKNTVHGGYFVGVI
jgi:hypothetical protein